MMKANAFSKVLTISVLLSSSLTLALPKANYKVPDPKRASATIPPEELKKVGIDEKLGTMIDFHGLDFVDETDVKVNLGTYFTGDKPIVLVLAYYNCDSLCNLLLTGTSEVMQNLKWSIGEEFDVVTVSFDPKDTPEMATMKKDMYLSEYGRMSAKKGWHFLTGKESAIKNITQQVGFKYKFDEGTKQYAHSSALILMTPEGKISRYLHGITFNKQDVKLGLIEAGEGKVGNFVEQALMFCFRYDPDRKGYALVAFNIVQYASIGLAILIFSYLFWFWGREFLGSRRRRRDGEDKNGERPLANPT